MDVQAGPGGTHPAQQVFVPFQGQVGMVPALQQDLGAAQAQGLVDLPGHLLAGDDVAFAGFGRAEEGAEAAGADADVGIVDVAVAHIGDDGLGMQAQAHGVGQPGQRVQGGAVIQGFGGGAVQALPG